MSRASSLWGLVAVAALSACAGGSTVDAGDDAGRGASESEDGAFRLDAGERARDASTAGADTGLAPTDAGLAPTDTGLAPTDAGLAPTDAGTDAGADAGGLATLTLLARDEARGGVSKGARVRVEWRVPGANSVRLQGAGELIALESIGPPSFDDMTGANAALGTAIAAAQVPFAVRLLGDSWPASARISISPRGIISRGLQSASTIVDPVLPIPRRTVAGDWADGTIAPYLDPRFEARDGTSRILTKAFDAGLPTERFVVEWNNFTTGVDFKPRLPVSLRIQAVLFADGSIEFRYPALPDPATSTPLGDGAFLRGQGASIGLASSGGATALVSQHMEALDPSGTTFRFVPTTQLPAEGRGLLVVPSNAPSALVVDLTGSNGASARQALTVREAYATPTSSTMGFMSIRQAPGVRALAFGSDAALPLEVPFPLQVFGEKWQSLAVFRAATVGPWGASVLGMTGGTNFDAAPFPKPVSPNGFVAGLYAANGSSWCTASGVPTVYASIREDTSPKTVTLEWPGLQRCGAQMRGTVDVQVTISADGSVSVHHGNVSPGATVTEQTMFVGLENGAGTLAVTEVITTSGGSPLPDNRVFTFTRP